jgi:hypothetical protein
VTLRKIRLKRSANGTTSATEKDPLVAVAQAQHAAHLVSGPAFNEPKGYDRPLPRPQTVHGQLYVSAELVQDDLF